MLISNQFNFLFVHIPKTAGLSVKDTFRPYSNRPKRTLLRRVLSKLPIREHQMFFNPPQHATAEWARRKLGEDSYSKLTSFAVVRHPYDRAISHYQFINQHDGHHQHKLVKEMNFEQYLKYLAGKPVGRRLRQIDFLVDGGGAIIVDRILRYESLEADIEAIWTELALPGRPTVSRRNASVRRAVDEYLTPRTRGLILDLYRNDFDRLGYEP